jgi:spoIIIJ-associated protein
MKKNKGGLPLIKEAIGFGATVDEAKENAIANLGASDFDDIQFEIISLPKKKVLGMFGGNKAEVKAFVEVPDLKPKKEKKEKPQKAKAKPVVKEEKAKPEVKAVKEYSDAVDASEIDAESCAGKAVAYVKETLALMGCSEIDIKVASRENGSLISIDGEDLSIVIGRRGETLDALQYLAGLAANNGGGHYKISLNIGNYREKREETLINLANRISAQVLKTGKSRTLEPMNPYERRIIHTAVQAVEGVVSNSFGEGNGRRIVISVEGAEVKPPRFNDRRRSGRPSRSQAPKTVAAPSREPKRDSDMPLYGKIN